MAATTVETNLELTETCKGPHCSPNVRQQPGRTLASSETTGHPGWRDPGMANERSLNSADPTNHRMVHMGV